MWHADVQLTFVEPVLASAAAVSSAGRGGREAAVRHCLVALSSGVPAVVILWWAAPWFMKKKIIR
jgi:hypothetical protein